MVDQPFEHRKIGAGTEHDLLPAQQQTVQLFLIGGSGESLINADSGRQLGRQ